MKLEQYLEVIEKFLKDYLEQYKQDGYVLGLSGGVDSSLVAALARRAVGKDKLMCIMMPIDSNPSDLEDAEKSAPHGGDLVCAAVSAVLTGGLNNLENPKDFDIILDEGYAYVKANESVSSHDEIVLETIICGLKTISEDNDKFITIKNL